MALANVHLVHYGKDLEIKGTYLDTLDKMDLESMDPKDVKFEPGHRYLVIWNDNASDGEGMDQPYTIIQKRYHIHYGPRSEGHWDLYKCPYITTRDNIIFKFIYKRYFSHIEWLSLEEYRNIEACIDQIKTRLRNAELEEGISKRTGKKWYRLRFDRLKEVNSDVTDFCEKTSFIKPQPEPKHLCKARTNEEIDKWFDWFIDKPEDTIFGLDYETCHGMPLESKDFEPVGVSLSCCDEDAACCYFDIQWMKYEGKDGEYDHFISRYRIWLDKFENSVTFNNSFEQKVTYLITHKLCMFEEAATVNKCDGLVYRRFSLKYTVQRCLGARSWDDDFDYLTGELLPDLMEVNEETGIPKWTLDDEYDDQGNLKMVTYIDLYDTGEVDEEGNPIYEEREVTVGSQYRNNPTWKIICDTYPDQISEFEKLFRYPKNWGDPYGCIPSDLHVQYCNRDAYFTGLLKIDCLKRYTPLCYYTYCNNLRLEALLHLTGCCIDVELRDRMELQCLWMMVYGKLHVEEWVTTEQLQWYRGRHVEEVPYITNILKMGYDPCDSKSILFDHLSETSESGIDEEFFRDTYGEEITKMMIGYIKEYCYRLDESFKRSRKVYQLINDELEEYFKPDYGNGDYCAYTINGKHYKIDMNYDMLLHYYELVHNKAMLDYMLKQLNFPEIEKFMLPHLGEHHLPTGFKAPVRLINETADFKDNGSIEIRYDVDESKGYDDWSLDDVIDWCDCVFNYKSPTDSPKLKFMVYKKYKYIINYAYCTGYAKLPRESCYSKDEFDELVKSGNIEYQPEEFELEWIDQNAPYIKLIDEDKFKETDAYRWYKMHGDLTHALYYSIVKEGTHCVLPTGEKDDEGHDILGWDDKTDEWMDTMSTHLTSWYDFILSSMPQWVLSGDDMDWIKGHFDEVDINANNVQALVKLGICYRMAKKYEKVCGTYIRGHFSSYCCDTNEWDENGVSTVQDGSGPVHKAFMPFNANEKKSKRWSSPWHTIPSKSEMKKIVNCPPGYLLSYFDISGCEIRTISYKSGDEFMMDCYNKGLDPYITMARFTYDEATYNPDDNGGMDYEDYLRSWRPSYKQILLGSLYGMGTEKMADMAEISLEEAEVVMDSLWKRCPGLKKFIEEKSQWAEDHPGFVQSALGDVMEMDEDDGVDRLARLGINQFIQNYSSVSLADGFLRCIEPTIHHNDPKIPDVIIRPAGVIHDSCQFYFTTKYLFRMKEYYTRHLTDYLFKVHGIYYTFDLELGSNFYDVADMSQPDDHHIQFTGSYTTLTELVTKCREDGLKFRISKLHKVKKKQAPEILTVNGFEFDPEFKPKLYNSILTEFLDYDMYAKFNEDKSKFMMEFEELPGNPGWEWTKEELATINAEPVKPKKSTWKPPF